jgi:hypothetical protein
MTRNKRRAFLLSAPLFLAMAAGLSAAAFSGGNTATDDPCAGCESCCCCCEQCPCPECPCCECCEEGCESCAITGDETGAALAAPVADAKAPADCGGCDPKAGCESAPGCGDCSGK